MGPGTSIVDVTLSGVSTTRGAGIPRLHTPSHERTKKLTGRPFLSIRVSRPEFQTRFHWSKKRHRALGQSVNPAFRLVGLLAGNPRGTPRDDQWTTPLLQSRPNNPTKDATLPQLDMTYFCAKHAAIDPNAERLGTIAAVGDGWPWRPCSISAGRRQSAIANSDFEYTESRSKSCGPTRCASSRPSADGSRPCRSST